MEAEWEINFGIQAAESLRVDDLIDFRNHDLLLSSSSSASRAGGDACLLPSAGGFSSAGSGYSASFADDIYIPSEEAAELEWLSEFMEDSFSNSTYNCSLFPAQASENCNISTSSDFPQNVKANGNSKKRTGDGFAGGGRRCTHCSSEKTPQWRTGPLGPKTLCNACGVRFKSGRLVPEYRPAASPTFVLTQHSNSHRKVMELRRQKETLVLNGSGEFVAGKTLAGL